jgi:hypothetical protein
LRRIYDNILDDFPREFGKALSKKEREEKKLYSTTLIYGEIDYDSFGWFSNVIRLLSSSILRLGIIFQKIRQIYGLSGVGYSPSGGIMQNRGGVFYDLGCGVGRAVMYYTSQRSSHAITLSM